MNVLCLIKLFYGSRADDCLRKEIERVAHYFYSSSELKVLEIQSFFEVKKPKAPHHGSKTNGYVCILQILHQWQSTWGGVESCLEYIHQDLEGLVKKIEVKVTNQGESQIEEAFMDDFVFYIFSISTSTLVTLCL